MKNKRILFHLLNLKIVKNKKIIQLFLKIQFNQNL